MNVNKKIFAVILASTAVMLSAGAFFATPMYRDIYIKYILSAQGSGMAGPAPANPGFDCMIIYVSMVLLAIVLLAASAYITGLILRPVNDLIKKVNRQFNPAGQGNLKAASAHIDHIVSNIDILDTVPIGVMVADPDGVIRFFNREAGEITGHAPSAVVGRPMVEFFPNNYYSYTMDAIKTGREYLSLRNIIRAGIFFKELLFNISPLRNENAICGAVAVFQDVTPQRKMIEVQAAYTLARDMASQKDLKSTVQVIARAAAEMMETEFSAVFLADPDGRLIICSSYGIPDEAVEKNNASPHHVDCPEIKNLYRNKVPLLHVDVRNNPDLMPLLVLPGVISLFSFPILHEERLIGFLNLYSRRKDNLSRDRIHLLQSLSGYVNVAIVNYYEFQKMRAMASTDGLTGLFNKNYFLETAGALLPQASDQAPLSLAIIDIDHFKSVNDTYGHQAGDHLLREIARLIVRSVRETDCVCRYGGEEFALIMPSVRKSLALELVDRIRSLIEGAKFSLEEHKPVNITVSAGVATCPGDATSVDDLIFCSDTALYAAKRSGRNKVLGYEGGK